MNIQGNLRGMARAFIWHMRFPSTAKAPLPKKPYGGFSLWGVPYTRVDIDYATAQIRELYFSKFENPNGAMQALLEYNEKVVSRCAMLMSFSSVLIAVSLF